MNLFFILSFIFIFTSCSFDNKSGIWKNENNITTSEDQNLFKDFKKIYTENENFSKIIPINKNYKFDTNDPYLNNSWHDIFYNKRNNLINFEYDNLSAIVHKSKKLTKNKANNHKLYSNNNLIISDKKGNIIVYSPKKNSIISRYNFYKKQFKNIEKELNLATDENIIFVSDNIGFVYAFDYLKNKIIWAKNYKIPFLSNIKLLSEKLILSNQNNDLFIINKFNGSIIKQIPSENTPINNIFKSNISLNNDSIFFLNTYGSLYSIDQKKFNINWFINFNSSLNLNLSSIFLGSIIVNNNEKIVLSANKNFYIIDAKSGFIIEKKNFSSKFNPLVINNYVFLLTDNNLLISFNINDGEIIYSYNIEHKIAEYLRTKKKNLEIKNIQIADSKIFIFLKNSYLIKLSLEGEIVDISKLPSKLETSPIFVNNSLYYLSRKNKLLILN